MEIKSPFADAMVTVDPALCSKTQPDEDGVLKTGYVATCPKTKGQFEVRVVITGLGTKQEQAAVEAHALQPAALLANRRNALADKVRGAASTAAEVEAVEAVGKMNAVAEAAGVTLTDQMLTKLMGTVKAQKVAEAAVEPLAKFDEEVAKEKVVKTVVSKKLAEAALAKLAPEPEPGE